MVECSCPRTKCDVGIGSLSILLINNSIKYLDLFPFGINKRFFRFNSAVTLEQKEFFKFDPNCLHQLRDIWLEWLDTGREPTKLIQYKLEAAGTSVSPAIL